jgi:WD40 repeat protein
MSPANPSADAGILEASGPIAAARDGVREMVAGSASGNSGRRWLVPLAAAAAVAAAACAPIAWPLLAGGALVAPAALNALFGQVGGVGGGLLTEVVIRTWDRLQDRKHSDSGIKQSEFREALADDLKEALTSSSVTAAGLRAELAGVLHRVDAVGVALTTTVEATVRESSDEVRAVLIEGLRDLGTRFSEFSWMLDEVSDQLARIAESQAELAAGSRAMLAAQQQTLMQLTMLLQRTSSVPVRDGGPDRTPEITSASRDEERAARLDADEVPVSLECPYPGLASFGPQDASLFFGRQQLTAIVLTRLAEQLTNPGLLMVLGPSGSGKSSLLRAGVLPTIAVGGLPARESSSWPLDLMTPGRRPLLELATRVAALAGIPAGGLNADLCTDPARITAAIRQALLAQARRRPQFDKSGQEAAPIVDVGTTLEDVNRPADAANPVPSSSADASRGPGIFSPRLVLIVDQFEEVFTQCTDEQERRAFVHALCAAAGATCPADSPFDSDGRGRGPVDSRDAPALVIIGLRADFYARSAAYPELVPYLQNRQVLVGPMDQAGLRAAIEGPAASAGLVVDAGLVEVLLADLGVHPGPVRPPGGTPDQQVPEAANSGGPAADSSYEAGRLPLLAYALRQTWQHREGRRLTVAAYRATGGIDQAVARAADAVYEGLDSDGKQVARRLLLRLVSPGENIADTRRRVTVTELTGATELPGPGDIPRVAAAQAVLTNLIQARLLTTDTDTDGKDTVEISHEALLWAWPRLREWLNQDRAGQRIRRDLTDATHAWQAQGHEPSQLFGGTRLAVAREWAASHGQDLNPDERAFLTACQERERRTTRLRRAAVATLAMLTLVAACTAGYAFYSRHQAVSERDQAVFNEVSAEAASLTKTNPSLAAEFNLAAYRMNPTPSLYTNLINTEATSLANPLGAVPTPLPTFSSIITFGAGGRILVGAGGRTIRLWNTTDPERPASLGSLPGIAETVDSVSISPDGHTLAAGLSNGTVRMWNIANPARPNVIGQPLHILLASAGVEAAFDPRGQVLLTWVHWNRYRFLEFWNVSQPAKPKYLSLLAPCFVDSFALSPSGSHVAMGCSNGKVYLADVTDPARPQVQGWVQASTDDEPINSLAFSPDGGTLVSAAYDDQTFSLWNVADPQRPASLGSPVNWLNNGVYSASFSPDGPVLATADHDGTVQLWNIADPASVDNLGPPMDADAGPAIDVAFSPDGQTVAVGYVDGTMRLWSIPHPLVTANGYGTTDGLAFSADGSLLASSNSQSSTLNLWQVTGHSPPRKASSPAVCANGKRPGTELIAFAPRSPVLAAGCYGGFQLWDVANPFHVTALSPWLASSPGNSWVNSVAFDHSGKLLAAAGNGHVTLWNVADPARPAKVGSLNTGLSGYWTVISISPDDHTLAVGASTSVQLWNITNPAEPRLIARPLPGPTQWITYITFSHDGDMLAAASADDNIYLWNTGGPHPGTLFRALAGHTDLVTSLAFSPDDKTLASSSDDDTVRLWNTAPPESLGNPLTGHTDYALAVAFSPVGHTLASIGYDDTVYLWDLNVQDAISRICAATAGILTPSQWHQDLAGVPYNPPCPTQ